MNKKTKTKKREEEGPLYHMDCVRDWGGGGGQLYHRHNFAFIYGHTSSYVLGIPTSTLKTKTSADFYRREKNLIR